MRTILFDIDGTLLSCGPQVRPIFRRALEGIFGTAGPVDDFDFAGKTDPLIVLGLMEAAGIGRQTAEAGLPRVRDAFRRELEEGLRREGMRLMPAVTEVLEALAALAGRGEVQTGLLTGNWEPSGRIKLSRFDLNRFFAFGAFGDDGVERPDLVPAALERAGRRVGRELEPGDLLIVGDTPHDVACGRAHGVPTVAVATGHAEASELEAAGADWVVEDLRQLGPVVEAWGLRLP